MAIGTDAAIRFTAGADEVTIASPALIDGNNGISLTSDINVWTNDDDAGHVSVLANVTYAAVPDTGVLELYCTLNDVEGSNDEPTMDANFFGHFLGSRTPDEVTSSQYLIFPNIELPYWNDSQIYQFYLRNAQGDAAHDISAGWSLWVKALAWGPHA
jgi:hypothetical protein